MINSELQDKKPSTLDCPVDLVKVDENRVRVVAFFVLLIVVFYIINSNPLPIAVLLADFAIRAFNLNNYSPLAIISGAIVKQLGLKAEPVDRAPKRFAVFVGIAFLCFVLIANLTQYIVLSKGVAGVVIVFASLESFAGFCAGCYVYTFLNRF